MEPQQELEWMQDFKTYHSSCGGKHQDIDQSQLPTSAQFYPLMMKEDTAARGSS